MRGIDRTTVQIEADGGIYARERGAHEPRGGRPPLGDVAVGRGIRSMVRKGEVVRDAVNLNDVIASALQFVRSDALECHSALITELNPKLPLVGSDQVQLQQVISNIAINAVQAMDGRD